LIIGGHSQTIVNPPYKSGKTIIVQAGENAQNVGELVLKIGADNKIESYKFNLMPLTKDIPDDPEARSIVNEFKALSKKN
jgi:2',3'-cyclic-nucleotide 2'-phosphodiesterase (5'-nucleotidase family)